MRITINGNFVVESSMSFLNGTRVQKQEFRMDQYLIDLHSIKPPLSLDRTLNLISFFPSELLH